MSDVHDLIPRSTLTTDQQRRLGSVQAAKRILYGSTNYSREQPVVHVDTLIKLADYIAKGTP